MFRKALKPAYVPAASSRREALQGARGNVTSVEPEFEELRGRVLEIIGAYGMGVSLDSRETTPEAAPPEPRRQPRD
jgi:hypothetical protein